MHHPNRSQEGFTLVEIMIVVAIIALLAALAIPAWQKIRLTAICSTMDNDARQLASAAQQYFMEYGATSVTVSYASGVISGPLADRVHFVGSHYSDSGWTLSGTGTFNLTHPNLPAPRVYDPEGKYRP